MGEMLSIVEIEKRYPDEWVMLDEPEVDESLRPIRGRVVLHGRDRDEFDRKSLEIPSRSAAILHTGSSPSDMVLVL